MNRRFFVKKAAGFLAAIGAAAGVKAAGVEVKPWVGGPGCTDAWSSKPVADLKGWPTWAKRLHLSSQRCMGSETFTVRWPGLGRPAGVKEVRESHPWYVIREYLNRDGTTTYEAFPTLEPSLLKYEDEPIGTFS